MSTSRLVPWAVSILAALLNCAWAATPRPPAKAVSYAKPKGSVIPYYRLSDARGKIPFYGEYSCQFYRDGVPASAVRTRCFDNLRRIVRYSTIFQLDLRYSDDDYLRLYEELLSEAVGAGQLVWLSAYGREGVDRAARLLDRLELRHDGQQLIRNIFSVQLADEPYLGSRTREQVEELIAYYDKTIKARYPHLQSWINFAVSSGRFQTWSTGVEGKPYQLLPRGLDLVSVDWYAWVGDGTKWGTPRYLDACQTMLDSIANCLVKRDYVWNQTRRMQEAIKAVYPEGKRPMMLFLGNSSYVCGQTHPMTVQSQDAYFEAVRQTEWAGLLWFSYEDLGEYVGGTRPDLLEAHARQGRRIRGERLY